jgi:prepilin-type N-terminal cleavage/methylation domain-containing protein
MKALIKRYKEEGAEGFTLIELLIVIVILGILSTVVVFAVQGITNKGQSNSCKADKNTLEVAVEAYNANYGAYPTAMSQLLPPSSGSPTASAAGLIRSASQYYTVSTGGALVAQGASTTPAYTGTNPCS